MPSPAMQTTFSRPRRWTALLLLLLPLLAGADAPQRPPLAEKYRQWLDLVDYIITPDERKIFLDLANDRDREAFIGIFWNQRDPSRGTPENEFKDEHVRRFEYANRYYGFTSPLPGWKTDRGRIHILLGPPANRNEIFNSYLYPIEIWEYYGEPGKGLPTMFHVVFYRKGGAGDFKLYIPAVDGPDQLLVTQVGEFKALDFRAVVKKIQEIKPEVAEIALTLIPGEPTGGNAPSMRDLSLMAKISDLPKENINTTYANQFLRFKSYVDVEKSADYLGSRHELVLLRDPVSNLNFLHFAIWPERISLDYSEDTKKYTCSYRMVVDLRRGDQIVYQHAKTLPFSYGKEEMEKTLAEGLVIADLLPVIEGEFELTVRVQNSVNSEFASFNKKVRVPPAGTPAVFGPVVSSGLRRQARAVYSAYSLQNLALLPDPRRTFGETEPLQALFVVDHGQGAGAAELELSSVPAAGAAPVARKPALRSEGGTGVQVISADLGALPAGYYVLRARLRGAGNGEGAAAETTFTVSRRPRLSHPTVAAPIVPASRAYIFLGMLAAQYEASGRPEEAGRAYEQALRQGGDNAELRVAYSRFLLAQGRTERVLEVTAAVSDQGANAFDRHSLRGKAFYRLGRWQEAVDELLRANALYDSDVTVLNALGLSFLRLERLGEARKALAASLKIKADQPDIKALLEKTEAP